jgi:hypothetical protein
MFLSGLTAGYPGEAPRAAMETLIDAGFTIVDAERVFRDRQVLLRQPCWPPDPPLPVAAFECPMAPVARRQTPVRSR